MLHWLYLLADRFRHAARARRLDPAHAEGRYGEDLAHRFLERHGFQIVARNFRARSGAGEIDLVAWERGTLVFVEVKTRTTSEHGEPERAIGEEKQTALLRTAREYARRANVKQDKLRFDVVSIVLEPAPRSLHFRDAFYYHQEL